MRQNFFSFLFTLLIISSCSNSPEELLEQSKSKISNAKSISYETKALYPNPAGQIDTLNMSAIFLKNKKSITGYDFILKGYYSDEVQINGMLKSVVHRSKTVERFPESKPELAKSYINSIGDFKWSPLTLIQQNEWVYVNDTVLNNRKLVDFFKVESDTIIEGNKIYAEQHIFINPEAKLIERWERRNYYKGKLSQTLVHKYTDYKFATDLESLAYNPPSSFVSAIYGTKKDIKPLAVGEKAPFFKIKNLHGELVDLQDYKGKKILLNFSSIGCGYCHEALLYMNQDDYKLSDDIQAFYLSIYGQAEKVERYFTKMNISYPIIPNADEVGKMYGVISTPNYFLINEYGVIEKFVKGYDKDFLESLNSH
jgi:peroxiredoxin